MTSRTHTYFLSDFHLGSPDYDSSLVREKRIVQFLDEIAPNARAIYLMGDVFDFWFEYRSVVPRNFVRLLGKLAELTDSGIEVHFFKGNHDMWTFGYLEKELGLRLHDNTLAVTIGDKRFFLGHGDGKGPGDVKYKILRKVFRSRFNQWLLARIHPDFTFRIATRWSYKSRIAAVNEHSFLKENEWLYRYCERKLEHAHYDYFIFGHRHLPIHTAVGKESLYINLGDWIVYNTYAVFDGHRLDLLSYPGHEPSGFGRQR
ncbi:MAG: UDP-2,3-diacylglucosamine diphosphatase [Bacteroidia bacterium]